MSLLTLNPKIQNFKTLQNPSIQITPNYTQTAFSLFTSYSSQLQNSIPNLGISPLFDSQTPTFLVMPQPKSRAKKEKKKRKKKKEGSQMLFFWGATRVNHLSYFPQAHNLTNITSYLSLLAGHLSTSFASFFFSTTHTLLFLTLPLVHSIAPPPPSFFRQGSLENFIGKAKAHSSLLFEVKNFNLFMGLMLLLEVLLI